VLLVDDSAFFLGLVGPALRAAGFDVATAGDGAEALDRLERGERYDVIVSDIDMPRVDGFELARRVSESAAWSGMPVLALTGRAAADRDAALGAGFREFLHKFDRDAVVDAVRDAARAQTQEEVAA
jgi:two-component system, chemotaxis family, sensor kinase CheA